MNRLPRKISHQEQMQFVDTIDGLIPLLGEPKHMGDEVVVNLNPTVDVDTVDFFDEGEDDDFKEAAIEYAATFDLGARFARVLKSVTKNFFAGNQTSSFSTHSLFMYDLGVQKDPVFMVPEDPADPDSPRIPEIFDDTVVQHGCEYKVIGLTLASDTDMIFTAFAGSAERRFNKVTQEETVTDLMYPAVVDGEKEAIITGDTTKLKQAARDLGFTAVRYADALEVLRQINSETPRGEYLGT